jgi:hypothetical protein
MEEEDKPAQIIAYKTSEPGGEYIIKTTPFSIVSVENFVGCEGDILKIESYVLPELSGQYVFKQGEWVKTDEQASRPGR